MSKKFRGKYRIESTRLKNWDYGWNAAYYITICTQDRVCFFGHVENGEMILNEIGLIAQDCWSQIPDHFPFVKLGVHVVMPNHIHGIVVIDKSDDERNDGCDDGVTNRHIVETQNVETQNFASLPPVSQQQPQQQSEYKNKFGPQSQNLASIIRGFKIGVTKNSRTINPDFKRQPRFHDHIIRDDDSFHRISKYIINNPLNWKDDEFFKS